MSDSFPNPHIEFVFPSLHPYPARKVVLDYHRWNLGALQDPDTLVAPASYDLYLIFPLQHPRSVHICHHEPVSRRAFVELLADVLHYAFDPDDFIPGITPDLLHLSAAWYDEEKKHFRVRLD